MASFKTNPLFFTSLIVLGALTAGQAWLVYDQRGKLSKLTREVAQKKQSLDAFASQDPFPSQANLDALEKDLAQARVASDDIRSVLSARGEVANQIAAAPVPASSTDAYFDIASFVERIRTAAKEGSIRLDDKNRLGFATYANTGPDRELIAPVFRQRQHIEFLLNALIKSAPVEILTVQRERPFTADQLRQIAEALSNGQPAPVFGPANENNVDYFVIDSRTTARVPNFVNASAYRLSFRGNTLALRALLNELALFQLPVVVRSVEVAPAVVNPAGAPAAPAPAQNTLASIFGTPASAGAAPVKAVEKPLVDQNDSRFTVTVEFVSLVDKNAAAEAANP
jgi:hypothetical protein